MTRDALADAPERPITVGSRVGGYRVERVVDRRAGLYTAVEASAPDGGRVALKVLAREISDDAALSGDVLQLAKLRASIKHPCLLPVRKAGRQGRFLYVANPIARGRTLADRLSEGPLPPEEALAVADQVSAGLDAAAARGLIHRELEPKAIFLTDGDPIEARLGDFGIAIPDGRACGRVSTVEGADYQPPEVVRGDELVQQSNVYALGCILVECLTGEPPFPHERPLLTLHAHLVDEPPRVSERNPELPLGLDKVVATALAKRPEERFHSATQLARALRLAIAPGSAAPELEPEPEPEAAPPATPEPRQRPRSPRAPRRRRRRGVPVRLAPLRGVPAFAIGALLLATISGFALGSLNGASGSSGSDRAAAPSQPQAAVPVANTRKARDVSHLNAAMDQLVARRLATLHRLNDARAPSSQATWATRLARVYGQARRTIASTAGTTLDVAAVTRALRAGEIAYRSLAKAASDGDTRAYTAARQAVASRENDLEGVVGSLAQQA